MPAPLPTRRQPYDFPANRSPAATVRSAARPTSGKPPRCSQLETAIRAYSLGTRRAGQQLASKAAGVQQWRNAVDRHRARRRDVLKQSPRRPAAAREPPAQRADADMRRLDSDADFATPASARNVEGPWAAPRPMQEENWRSWRSPVPVVPRLWPTRWKPDPRSPRSWPASARSCRVRSSRPA